MSLFYIILIPYIIRDFNKPGGEGSGNRRKPGRPKRAIGRDVMRDVVRAVGLAFARSRPEALLWRDSFAFGGRSPTLTRLKSARPFTDCQPQGSMQAPQPLMTGSERAYYCFSTNYDGGTTCG